MILRRLGNKSKIAEKIQAYIPPPSVCGIWIEPFFGAGGMFFNLNEKRQYNIVNDNDTEVFNLYKVLRDNPVALRKALEQMPVDETLFKEWKTKKEKTPLMQAVRFLFLSNFGYKGKADTLHFGASNSKKIMLSNIEPTLRALENVQIANADFKVFLKTKIARIPKHRGFIYADPPYLGTTNDYETDFKEKDSKDLFEALTKTKMRWAMSEFDHPFILAEAKRRKLEVVKIGERRNISNRRTEILIVNYDLKTFKIK